jgi:hypothetical protein
MSIMTHVQSCPHNPVSEFVGDSGPHWIVSVSIVGTLVSSLCSTTTGSSDISTLAIRTMEEPEISAVEEPEQTFPQDLETIVPTVGDNGEIPADSVVTATLRQNTLDTPSVGWIVLEMVDRIVVHETETGKEVGAGVIGCREFSSIQTLTCALSKRGKGISTRN